MTVDVLKRKLIGKNLETIITLKLTPKNKEILEITGDINSVQIMICGYRAKQVLAFIDYDEDGYRSGVWETKLQQMSTKEKNELLRNVLDEGNTLGIKHIGSTIKEIESGQTDDEEYILIITDEYVVKMGQDTTDNYYPQNFFDIEEIKDRIAWLADHRKKLAEIKKEEEKHAKEAKKRRQEQEERRKKERQEKNKNIDIWLGEKKKKGEKLTEKEETWSNCKD